MAIPILGGWAMCPCTGAGSSLRSPRCSAGTLELVPGHHSSSSTASALWSGCGAFPGKLSGSSGFSCGIFPGFGSLSRSWRNPSLPTGVSHSFSRGCHVGALECVCHRHSSSSSASGLRSARGAPFPESLPGSSGLSCGICPGFASFLCATVRRNQSLPTGVSRSSLRGHRVGALECVCHQHSSSSSASALRSARESLSGCPALSRRACPSHGNAPCPCSTCGGPVTVPAGSMTCGTCAGIDVPARRPGRHIETSEFAPLRVCPLFSAAATTSSSGSRCLGCAKTAGGHRGATSWISLASSPRARRARSVRSSCAAAAPSGRAISASCRRPAPAPRGTGPRAGGRGGAWAAGTAGTRPRPGSSPTGTAGRSSAGTSWSTRCRCPGTPGTRRPPGCRPAARPGQPGWCWQQRCPALECPPSMTSRPARGTKSVCSRR
ncbi:dnaJ homolog subfamily C member 17 isoform X1 [Vidua chalybeata]|uniref:dnaJ homolog subfamily C member 17 isoform X1 n=1 Tax=Vidua chalybeata TaxID=81927 RepID=UPI0023A891E6|nr:dnaJ homolog subfamily C member 17 isoform X1 [Vidua chalybeata]